MNFTYSIDENTKGVKLRFISGFLWFTYFHLRLIGRKIAFLLNLRKNKLKKWN